MRKASKSTPFAFFKSKLFWCLFTLYDPIPNFYNACALINYCNVNIWYKARELSEISTMCDVVEWIAANDFSHFFPFHLFLFSKKLYKYYWNRNSNHWITELTQDAFTWFSWLFFFNHSRVFRCQICCIGAEKDILTVNNIALMAEINLKSYIRYNNIFITKEKKSANISNCKNVSNAKVYPS